MARDLEMHEPMAGAQEAEEEEEQEHRPKHLSDMPMRCVKRVWPTLVTWLDAIGYDQALVVQDCTHMSIYLSCFVSFVFSAMWLVDVFTLNCAMTRPGDEDIGGDNVIGQTWRCMFELVGGLVFFGSLCDSIVMLGNYDTEHQQLLDRKKTLMAELHTDIKEALGKAKANADALYGMLFSMYEQQVGNHVENIFEVILPILDENFLGASSKQDLEERQEDEATLKRLAQLLQDNLSEPGQLSSALCRKLPEMYKSFNKVDRNFEATCNIMGGDNPPAYWVVLMQGFPNLQDAQLSGSFLSHASSQMSHSSSQRRDTSPTVQYPVVSQAEAEDMRSNPKKYVFAPVRKMVVLLEKLLANSENLTKPTDDSALQNYGQLIGMGAPPPLQTTAERAQNPTIHCCMPRFVAFCLLRICCFCCCCRGALEPAMRYPKQVRLGFCWFQIVSKLHERLISSLIFSIFFASFYTWRVVLIVEFGCPHNAFYGSFWACLFQEIKRCSLMLALFCHVPANFLCLVRIRELDAVIKIMEDIRKLQGLRGIIQDFSRTLQHDAERQALLNAVRDRVLTRIKIVETFRRHIINVNNNEQKKTEPEVSKVLLREATRELVRYFNFAAATLKPASQWLDLPSDKQEERVKKIIDVATALEERNFRPGAVPAPELVVVPSSSTSGAPPADRPDTPPMTPISRRSPLLESGTSAGSGD